MPRRRRAVSVDDDRPHPAGKLDRRRRSARAGEPRLYSITPNNNRISTFVTINAYKEFRERSGRVSAISSEVFDPTLRRECPADLGRFINDLIVRTLAGVPSSGRPVFLKIAYHGPKAMRTLVAYDPHLVPESSRVERHDARRVQAARRSQALRARAALFRPQDHNSGAPAHR